MNFHARCLCDASAPKVDPTGTMPLRDRFRRDLDKRWDALRRLTIEAISKSDILGLGGPSVDTIRHSAQQTPHSPLPTADKVKGFQSWIDEAMRQVVLDKDGAWTRPYVEAAAKMAKTRAETLTGRSALVRESRVRDLASLTVVELQGVIEAVSQQTVRALAHDLMANARPRKIARDVALRIEKIGKARGRMLVGYMVVKTFNSATLDAFRSLGIKKVGVVPERLRIKQGPHGKTLVDAWIGDAARKTKQKRHGGTGRFVPYTPFPSKREYESILKREANLAKLEMVEVLTAGDEFVCQVCEDISDDGPYDIDEAEGLIPAHPDCRCAFVPAMDERFAEDVRARDEYDPELHPHGEHGHFETTGGGQKPEPSGLKHFKPSANANEHVKAVSKMLETPALQNHTYRWRVGKLVEETKQYQTKFAPDLKLKIAESFGLERQKFLAKGDQATADKLLGKMKGLGWKDDGSQKPAAAPKPVSSEKPSVPKPAAEAPKTTEMSPHATGTAKAQATYEKNTGGKKLSTLESGKEKIKATVQTKGDVETATKIMTPAEQESIKGQYGSVATAFGKSQQYYASEQANKVASEKAAAAHKEAAAKEQAELDKIANDPEVAAHYQVLKDITGGGKEAKNYVDHANNKIKSAGLSGKITGPEAAHIIAYSGSHYGPVNRQLRENMMTEQQFGFAKHLNDALDKLPPHVGTTYRKASIDEQYAKVYKAGMIIQERGFTSSSKNSGTWSGSLQFEIHGKSGRDISKLSSHPGESEVLFKFGTHFRVESRTGSKIVLKEV